MEDFGLVEWLAVLALTAEGIRRAGKAAKKGTKRRQPLNGEAWPDTAVPPQERAEKQRQPRRENPESISATEKPSVPHSEETTPRRQQRTEMSSQTEHKDHAPRETGNDPATGQTGPNKAETEPREAHERDFDLRQAIIMSEILKPKFDE